MCYVRNIGPRREAGGVSNVSPLSGISGLPVSSHFSNRPNFQVNRRRTYWNNTTLQNVLPVPQTLIITYTDMILFRRRRLPWRIPNRLQSFWCFLPYVHRNSNRVCRTLLDVRYRCKLTPPPPTPTPPPPHLHPHPKVALCMMSYMFYASIKALRWPWAVDWARSQQYVNK